MDEELLEQLNEHLHQEKHCKRTMALTLLITVSIELVASSFAIGHAILVRYRHKKNQSSAQPGYSVRVNCQMGLMLAQAILGCINNFWNEFWMDGLGYRWNHETPKWARVNYMVGNYLFYMQMVLYTGHNVRVAVDIPNAFCLQSDDVIARR